MINKNEIDRGFEFYNIDNKYKNICYECVKEINDSKMYTTAFNRVYELLYKSDFNNISKLWDIKDINELFTYGINPFVTNIMVLLGYSFHIINMKKHDLNDEQIEIHKKRVKECFENDVVNRGYKGIRISQMLWAVYFIRVRIIEVGLLQYEYCMTENNKIIKIHIPRVNKLEISSVKNSIDNSKKEINRIFKISNFEYICNSWLLSNQLHKVINKDTNIYKFQELFEVRDGENCINDILNFVYETDECKNYSLLSENTSLQRKIKKELINGTVFNIGIGTLRKCYYE